MGAARSGWARNFWRRRKTAPLGESGGLDVAGAEMVEDEFVDLRGRGGERGRGVEESVGGLRGGGECEGQDSEPDRHRMTERTQFTPRVSGPIL